MTEVRLPITAAAMRVIGWYLAEGSLTWRKRVGRYPSKVRFSLGAHEVEQLDLLQADLAEIGFKSHRTTAVRGKVDIGVASRPLAELLSCKFGSGAANKNIPMDILLLPQEKLAPLFEAYLMGDGHVRARQPWYATAGTISLNLALSVRLLGEKLGYNSGVQRGNPGGEDVIEGRLVNTHPSYTLAFSTGMGSSSSKRLDDGSGCVTIRPAIDIPFSGRVYNLEVEEDNSYCTPGHVELV